MRTRIVGTVALFALGAACRADQGPPPSIAWEREAAGRTFPLSIVSVDGDTIFQTTNTIVVVVESWDPAADAVVPLADDAIAFFADGEWLSGRVEARSVADRGQVLALGVVVAGDAHFNDETFAAIDKGLDALGTALGKDDVVSIWIDGPDKLKSVGQRIRGSTLGDVSAAAAPREVSLDPVRALERALQEHMRFDAELPAQRHLLVISDGHGPAVADPKLLQNLAELANTASTRIEFIGIEQPPPALGSLEEVAVRTLGRVRKVPAAEVAQRLPLSIASVGHEMKSRWVIRLSAARYRGAEQPVARFEIVARASDGRVGRAVLEHVKLVPPSVD